ncbi:TonB-dependent receptor [Tenacibaculum xiamenense]|uniref:TonB-dependent receptor n=1 Tax=Tenacibaculum xiamenense TaxID=1261553 RepID=UPI00389397D6
MNLKSIVLVLLMICTFASLRAQDCKHTFSGLVEDFHDKSPIIGATVFIKNLNKYTTTDTDGKFSIKNICSGKITVEISHVACDPQIFELQVNGDTYKVIDLEHHIEELNEISVKGSVGLKTKTSQETLLKTETLENYSNANLGDAIKKVSGVSSINTGNSIVKPVINGLHSSRVLISFNNVRLQDQEWGIEHAPNIDINAAGSVSVIKGANALQYGGDAIGGVVIVNPVRTFSKDTLLGKTIVSQQSNGHLFSATSSIRKNYRSGWFINGQASYKRAGDFRAPDYYLTNTGIDSKSFTVGTGFKKFDKGFEVFYSHLTNELGILRASHIGNVTDLVNAINTQKPLVAEDFSFDINNPKQDVTHQLLKATAYKRFKGFGKVSFQYDYQRNKRLEFDIRRGGRSTKPALDLLLQTHSAKVDLHLDSNSENIYKFGINSGYQNNFPEVTGVRRLIPDYDRYYLGAYAISNIKLNRIFLELGLRYDFDHINAKKFYKDSFWEEKNYQQDFGHTVLRDDVDGSQLLANPKFNYHNFSASIGASHNLNDKNSITMNYGLSNRAPNPSELFSDGLHHSAARIELGDLRIQPETSHRVSATYQYDDDKFNIRLEGFYNYISDFIYIEPSGVETTLRGAFPVWSYKQINAQLLGIDTHVQYQLTQDILFSNKLSYLNGRDLSTKRSLIDIPPFKSTTSLLFKKPNWKNFYASLESEFNAEQTQFPDNNFEAYIPTSDSFELVDVSTPPSSYHLLNFSSGFEFNLSQTKFGLNFSVDNILNTSYRNYLNRLRYFTDDLGRNFKIQLKIYY